LDATAKAGFPISPSDPINLQGGFLPLPFSGTKHQTFFATENSGLSNASLGTSEQVEK